MTPVIPAAIPAAVRRRPARLVPVAVASLLVLGACGSSDDAAGDTVPPATDADGGLLTPRPVRTAGGGAAGGAATSAVAEAAPGADRMTTDMMAPYRIVTFVPGEGLTLPTDDVGYLFEGGATTTAEQVATLAAALGVAGEPIRTDDGYSVYWRVGPDDGTAPSMYVYEDAQLSWNYNTAWADQAVSTGCAVIEPDASATPVEGAATSDVAVEQPVEAPGVPGECVEAQPPENVPTAEQAEASTRELMAAVGLDPEAFTFQPYADEWFASVGAVEQLGGAFAGRRFDAGFGAEGALSYASGQLAVPAGVGPYPLVDLDTAVTRLNDTSGFYGGYGGGMVDARMMDVSVAAEPAQVESGASAGGVDGSTGDAAMPVESLPVETVVPGTMPPPEEVTVTLVDVEADVWWAYDVDGSVWLLPAYRFTGDDGSSYVVPAVTDEFLVQVPVDEVPMPEPMPVESVPAVDPGDIPVDSKPEVLPTESIPGEPALFDTVPLEASVGTTLAEFTAAAEALGASVRVIEIAGVSQPVTMDFSTTRVNVAVDGEGDGAIVTAIMNVG